MQVYKAFFRIIKKNITEIIIYIGVFLFFSIAFGTTSTNPDDMNFEETKINIAFINNDEDSTLVEGLRDYLKEHSEIVEIEGSKTDLQDALFFGEVQYIVTVTKGFTDSMLNGDRDIDIEKNTIPSSVSEVYMDNLINRYLNTAKKYTSTMGDISEKELVEYISNDLKNTTEVEVSSDSNGYIVNNNTKNYFNYLAYSVFAILILGVTSVMNTFNNKDLRMRNSSSSLPLRSMSFQMVMANITFAIAIWIVMIFTSFIIYGNYMFSTNGLLFLLNSFLFTMSALSISLLISNLISGRNAVSAASNVVSLGACFLSGVFVPQEYLGDTVISIAKFNPTYWYVKANNEISLLANYSMENLQPIFMSMLVVTGFSLAILSITLVVMKQKRIKGC